MLLKHRDTIVLRFDWSGPDEVRILSVDDSVRNLLPLGLGGDDRSLERDLATWLCRRTAPMGRHFVRDLMFSLGLNMRDPEFHRKALEVSLGLSLNDVYWVVQDGFQGSWEKCNLYANEFSKSMASIAFTGYGIRAADEATTSPEMTTNGMLPKCWRRIGNDILLYKAGTAEGSMPGRAGGLEPYSEYYAAQVAEAMGLKHVAYDLARFKGRLCSTCRLFTSERLGYLPAAMAPNRQSVISDPAFSEMFLFDAIIFNTDRHLGNFGYLVDNDSNRIVGAAPVFDNGYGLFSLMTMSSESNNGDFTQIQAFLHGKRPALFDRWLAFPGISAMSLRECVERLHGFRFHRHHHYNLPNDRLELIERFLQKRVLDIVQYLDCADDYLKIVGNNVGVNSKNHFADVGVVQVNDAFELQILWNLKANPLMTISSLASVLGREQRTVERRVRKLREAGLLRRNGSDKCGAWEVLIED